MQIVDLSNEQLLASLRTVVGDERRLVARVLSYLGEVEHRRLELESGHSSMYDYCTRTLGFSEDQACRRIAVARLGRRWPQLLEAIAAGRIHLSAVYRLRALFTDTNIDELIAQASGKSRGEVDRLIAKLAPRPDVPDSIRRLPEQATLVVGASSTDGVPSPIVVPTMDRSTRPIAVQLLPLAEDRYCITLTGSTSLRDKLEKVRSLTRHTNPAGDLAPIVERALELYIEKLEKERLGKVAKPRRSKGTKDPADVTRETRREVYERDGAQCSFVSSAGDRCPAREVLELDHRHARARGGKGDTANIRILCRAHNQLEAEKTFGREHMDAKRRSRKHGATTATAAPSARPRGERPTTDPPRLGTQLAAQAGAMQSAAAGARSPDGVRSLRAARSSHGSRAATDASAEANPHQSGCDATMHAPRDTVRRALLHLGFRAGETDHALARLPAAVWSETLEQIVRAAIAALT